MEAKDRDEFRREFRVKLECLVINCYFVTDGRTDITSMMTQSLSFLVKKQIFFVTDKTHLRL